MVAAGAVLLAWVVADPVTPADGLAQAVGVGLADPLAAAVGVGLAERIVAAVGIATTTSCCRRDVTWGWLTACCAWR
jgi:hypothetical protein